MYDQKWKYCAMVQYNPPPFSDTQYQLDVSLGVVQFHHHPLFSEEHVIASELRQIYHRYTTKLEQDRPRMLREKVCFSILVSCCLYCQLASPISRLSPKHTPPPHLFLLLICPSSSAAPPPQLLLLLSPVSIPHPTLYICVRSFFLTPLPFLFILPCSSLPNALQLNALRHSVQTLQEALEGEVSC